VQLWKIIACSHLRETVQSRQVTAKNIYLSDGITGAGR
jgi:hypothetical protein